MPIIVMFTNGYGQLEESIYFDSCNVVATC